MADDGSAQVWPVVDGLAYGMGKEGRRGVSGSTSAGLPGSDRLEAARLYPVQRCHAADTPMTIDLWWLGAGGSLGLGGGWWAGRQLFHHAILRGLRAPRVPHDPPLAQRDLPQGRLRALRLPGPRGRTLAAWVIAPTPAAAAAGPAALVMHGWGANASMMWPVVDPLLAAGFTVLLLDARCHGDSGDEPYTSLPRFAEDIAIGLDALRTEPGVDPGRVALVGHSVGAAACLLHAASRPAAVRAVVSLSAFAHPAEVMRRWLALHHIPYPLIGAGILGHVQRVIGARFDDIAPLRTIRDLRCPVLLVHGRDDDTVPFDDATRLLQAGATAQLLAIDGGHDLRLALAPHVTEVIQFLQRALQAPPP